jgi:hypothetical protein
MSEFAPRRTLQKPPDPNQHLKPSLADDLNAVQEVKILQKVNAAHREAFGERYPGQVEHCLRLTMERLQACLDKRGNVVANDPNTWLLPPVEIADLAKAAYHLHQIRQDLNGK